ncbi:MAG: hypothetical protein ACAI44_08075 [Candidatus Sericytochromatia bacterium]
MRKHWTDSHRVMPLVTILGLSACGPTPTTQFDPQRNQSASVQPSSQPSPETPAGESPAPLPLTLHLQADAALADFQTRQLTPFSLCLADITAARIVLSFAGELNQGLRTGLEAQGVTVSFAEGRTSLSLQQNLNLQGLLAGVDVRLAQVPTGPLTGRTSFLNTQGGELGFISWQAQLAPGNGRVSILLKPAGPSTGACPSLTAEVGGASAIGAGGNMQPAATPSPAPSTRPSPTPAPGLLPGEPLNPRLVEQGRDYLILQWDFHPDARSHKLYLDGQLVASDYVTPNYYRFAGLRTDTSYRLGVQSVNAAGESGIVTLTGITISGHSASGNFSGGDAGHPRPSATASPIGEFEINTYTLDAQRNSTVALDAEGNFVVVWESLGQDGDGYGIFGQRYDSQGLRRGSEFPINAYTTQIQGGPVVAIDADGDFVVAWSGVKQIESNIDIFGRRFNSQGVPQGDEFMINSYTTLQQGRSVVSMDADGDFVVVWTSYFGQDGSNGGVFGQRYDSRGNVLNSEFRVNSYTTNQQTGQAVQMDADGNFIVVWESLGQDGSGSGIFAQRYNRGGSPQGSEFRVNSITSGAQSSPDVALDEEGNFTVAWTTNGDGQDIAARRFDSSGGALDACEFIVNTYISSSQASPAIAMAGNGRFIVSWVSHAPDGDGLGIACQRFAANGNPLGSEFIVNTYTTGAQEFIGDGVKAAAMDAEGNFIVTWSSRNQDGSHYGVFGQRYDRDGDPR